MRKSRGMSKTMRAAEAASIERAMKGKPQPAPVGYQIFIEESMGQQKLPMALPPMAKK
jgi:hypothetical protein